MRLSQDLPLVGWEILSLSHPLRVLAELVGDVDPFPAQAAGGALHGSSNGE
jgi:hypothetical protein